MINFSLTGKVALVTGAAYGIGFAIARALAEAGAKIAFNCRSEAHMEQALADGKTLCVPLCTGPGTMELRAVRDLKELTPGAYGILEPREDLPILQKTKNAICIVPAFCNDFRGYRVGYGGGYYDRYLSGFEGVKIGINYSDCVRPRLIGGRYDVPIDVLVTDRYIRRCRPSVHRFKHKKILSRGRKETQHEE